MESPEYKDLTSCSDRGTIDTRIILGSVIKPNIFDAAGVKALYALLELYVLQVASFIKVDR